MDGWNKDNDLNEARNFYVSMGGSYDDPIILLGSKSDLTMAAMNSNPSENIYQQKVWHNQNNINQVEDVDRSSTLGKIIIGLVFLIILF